MWCASPLLPGQDQTFSVRTRSDMFSPNKIRHVQSKQDQTCSVQTRSDMFSPGILACQHWGMSPCRHVGMSVVIDRTPNTFGKNRTERSAEICPICRTRSAVLAEHSSVGRTIVRQKNSSVRFGRNRVRSITTCQYVCWHVGWWSIFHNKWEIWTGSGFGWWCQLTNRNFLWTCGTEDGPTLLGQAWCATQSGMPQLTWLDTSGPIWRHSNTGTLKAGCVT